MLTPIIGRAIAKSVCCRKSQLFKLERKLESVEERVKGVAAAPEGWEGKRYGHFFNNTSEAIVYHLLFSRGHGEGMSEDSVDLGNKVGDHSSAGSH